MTSKTIRFEDINLHLEPHQNLEFLLTNKEVADGYGVSIQSLSQAKINYPDELIKGKHYLRLDTQTNGGVQKVIHFYYQLTNGKIAIFKQRSSNGWGEERE